MSIKREFPRFALWDAEGMAAHLEAMEAKGWLFRGADWLGRWEFEENLPQTVRYAVAYTPSRRDWKLTTTESERELEEICCDAGWSKVAALSRFHIYRNPDPNATDLETDEQTRLDTLERALTKSLLLQSLPFLLWSVLILGILIWSFMDNLPRTLALPMLPFTVVFSLWLILDRAVPLILYRRWLKKARLAAETGLPCHAVRGWRLFSGLRFAIAALLLLGMVTQIRPGLTLAYTILILSFNAARWYLENRMEDEELAQRLFRVSLAVVFLLMLAINHGFQTAERQKTIPAPLSAQDLVDTSDMELCFYEMNTTSGPLASYRDYWQPDNNSHFSLRCTVFDLQVPMLEQRCRDWFEEDFHAMSKRMEASVEPADAAPWGADAVCRMENSWLIFYDDRVVELHLSWDLTPEQIAVAAERLAP